MTEQPKVKPVWRPVVGFPGYSVSDQGQIKYGRRLVTQHANKRGYLRATLWRGEKGSREPRTRFVHVVVAEAHLLDGQAVPQGYEVNHKYGRKADNRVSELEVITAEANQQHAKDTGLKPSGERVGSAKLTWVVVRAIRAMYATGTVSEGWLSDWFGVHKRTVARVIKNMTWTEAGYVPPVFPDRSNGLPKLSDDQVVDVRRRLRAGESHRAIGRFYLVHHSVITAIHKGRAYNKVPQLCRA